MNKYNKWYTNITENARTRALTGYVERHHIIPVSLGGSNNKENLVDLTAREHFICHWLLTKLYTGESRAKMIYALNGMKRNGQHTERYETKITSRVYENLKKEFSLVHSATMKGKTAWNKGRKEDRPEVLKNVKQAALKRKPQSTESRELQAQKTRGQKRTNEQRERMSNSMRGIKKGPMSQEEKDKRSKALLGRPKPPGFGKHLIESKRKEWTEKNPNKSEDLKKICPHCNGTFGPSNYARWHGANCSRAQSQPISM